jgi:hypothetical protein
VFVGINAGTFDISPNHVSDVIYNALALPFMLYEVSTNNIGRSNPPTTLENGMTTCQAVLVPCLVYCAIKTCCSLVKKDANDAQGHLWKTKVLYTGTVALQLFKDALNRKELLKSENHPLGILD